MSFCQQKYWIDLTEGTSLKQTSSILLEENIKICTQSEWLNAISVEIQDSDTSWISELSFVTSISPVKKLTPQSYQASRKMDVTMLQKNIDLLNLEAFQKERLTGKGVKVGIIDAGFENSDSTAVLSHLYQNNQIALTKDFVNATSHDFYTKKTNHDYHGRLVLSIMAGMNDTIKGIAHQATYYLARTEDGANESRIEEDHWIKAIEWMHTNGVRLVNTSLGYATFFDDSTENYLPNQMDGKTSKIALAARIAVRKKNMILVVSGGNMGGNKDWKVLTTPADAEEVIAVGAIDNTLSLKQSYSSQGGDQISYVKPDLVCYSPNGTSYSAPIITAMIACALQAQPNISNKRLKDALYKSCHLHRTPNDFVGRGYPDAQKFLALLNRENITDEFSLLKLRVPLDHDFKFEAKDSPVSVFHKSDKLHVIGQKEIDFHHYDSFQKELKNLDPKTHYTTFISYTERFIIEVEWKR